MFERNNIKNFKMRDDGLEYVCCMYHWSIERVTLRQVKRRQIEINDDSNDCLGVVCIARTYSGLYIQT